jgi:hypothetical protein
MEVVATHETPSGRTNVALTRVRPQPLSAAAQWKLADPVVGEFVESKAVADVRANAVSTGGDESAHGSAFRPVTVARRALQLIDPHS